MSDDHESPEYRTVIACTPELVDSLALDPLSVSDHLFASNLISSDTHHQLIHSTDSSRRKARELLSAVTDSVKANPFNFFSFVDVLQKQGDWSKDIFSILMKKFTSIRYRN